MKIHNYLVLATILAFGAFVRADEPPVSGVRELLVTGGDRAGAVVVLEGFVTGVCHSGGRKAFLHDTDPNAKGTLRVERTGSMPSFDPELMGQTLRVRGIVRELRIDAAYLDSWESRVKAVHAEQEAKEQCQGDCEASLSVQAALKRIAALRAQLAKSPRGYLSSVWVDGEKWEIVAKSE